MHELSVIGTLFSQLQAISAEHRLKRIKKVVMQIGDFRQCVPELLQFAFKTTAEGTIVEEAELVIERLPIRMECLSCHHVFTVSEYVFFCPKCTQANLKLLGGKELILSSVKGEQ